MSLHRRGRALTMIEVLISVAVLLLLMAGFGAMASVSVRTTREARPALIAQETAIRVAERLRSDRKDDAFRVYWTEADRRTIGGVEYAVGGSPSWQELLAPLLAAAKQGLIKTPTDDAAMLRIRFLSEREYQQVWGLSTPADLDFDGQTGSEPPTAKFRMLPVLIEVRWRGPTQDHRHQLKTVLTTKPPLDPRRGGAS